MKEAEKTTSQQDNSQQVKITQFNREPRTDHYNLDCDLKQKISDGAKPLITPRLGRWQLLDIRTEEKGALTMDLMINETGQAIQSFTKKTDGTLVFRKYGRIQNTTPNFSGTREWEEELHQWTRQEVLKAALKIMDRETIKSQLMNPHAPLQSAIRNVASDIIEEALVIPKEDDIERWPVTVSDHEIQYGTLRAQANDILRRKFINTDVRRLANQMFNPHSINNRLTIGQYNWTMTNRKIFQKLAISSPNVAQYYCQNILKDDRKPVKLRHPGQIITAVKNDVKLTPAQWKYFCRFPHPKIQEEQKRRRENIESLELGMTALVQINQPAADDEQLQRIASTTDRQNFTRESPQNDPLWTPWIQLARSYLKEFPQKKSDSYTTSIDRIIDAVRNYIDRGIAWGPGDWNTLQQRSERWHHEARLERDQKYTKEQEEAVWTSLLTSTTIDKYKFEPITNGPDLIKLSSVMHNCLWSYPQRCAKGESRIFAVWQMEDKPSTKGVPTPRQSNLLAAVELKANGYDWRLGQIEGPSRRKFPKGVRRAANKLKTMYQEAQITQETETR